MDDVRSATESLLADKPSLEADLETVLSVDADADGWTFDDVPLDSGTFGELVSRGVVEKGDDGDYRVADRSAVRAALDGEDAVREEDGSGVSVPSLSVPSVDRNAALALAGALLLVVAMRSFPIPSVFRGDAVVLSSNDPYYYRYLLEQMLDQSSNPLDFEVLSDLESGAAKGEPLLVAVLWFVAALFGGGQQTAGLVLALYPIIAAVVVGVLLYLLVVRLTSDRRAGLAAVLMLAVLPDHALRTAIGFADHHAFDYPWLVLTAYGLVRAAQWPEVDRRGQMVAAGCLTLGITAQVLAWEAGPLLILPVGIFTAVSALLIVRADGEPIRYHAPVLAGVGLGATIVWITHSALGWHTDLAALTPTLLFIGVLTVTLLAEVFVRTGFSAWSYAIVELIASVIVASIAFSLLPNLDRTLTNRLDFLFNTGGIAETGSLVQGDLGLVVSPIFWFGLVLFLAVPYLVWTTVTAVRRSYIEWLVPSTYAWFFLSLALIQVRFSGEAGAFVALFAGIGFVHLLSVVDVTDTVPGILQTGDRTAPKREESHVRISIPDRTTVQYVLLLFILVAGIGMLITPLKIDLTTIEGDQYETAAAIDDSSLEQGLEYPENYVLSDWSRNRMYNYFVNGESRSYRFARDTYSAFLGSTNSSNAYDQLNRRGYVVTESERIPSGMNSSTIGVRLHDYWGSASNDSSGLGHYRAIYATPDGSIKAFQVVPGAVIEGNVSPGQEITVSTTVSVNGHEFTYVRTATASESGSYRVRVAYPGEYSTEDGRITVSSSAVHDGRTVRVNTVSNETTIGSPYRTSFETWTNGKYLSESVILDSVALVTGESGDQPSRSKGLYQFCR